MYTKSTEIARKRYNRVATVYDLMEGVIERSRYSLWRQLLWTKVEGHKILEVGVGTGKNFLYYPSAAEITAIDLSNGMLARALEKARKHGTAVSLLNMDVQKLGFIADSFDSIISAFVFCSVPDPLQGLREVKRVCKTGGRIILLEHVLSANRILAGIMNLTNPVIVRMMGANINRRTIENVTLSGFEVEKVTDMAAGIFKLIEARKIQP